MRRQPDAGELGRSDAHDGGGVAVQRHGLADGVFGALKLVLPHVIRDDGRQRGRTAGFSVGKLAPAHQADTEGLEVIGGHQHGAQFERATFHGGDESSAVAGRGERREGAHGVGGSGVVQVIGIAVFAGIDGLTIEGGREGHQAAGMDARRGLAQNGVHQRVDGGVPADAGRDQRDGGSTESRRLDENARAIAEVGEELADERGPMERVARRRDVGGREDRNRPALRQHGAAGSHSRGPVHILIVPDIDGIGVQIEGVDFGRRQVFELKLVGGRGGEFIGPATRPHRRRGDHAEQHGESRPALEGPEFQMYALRAQKEKGEAPRPQPHVEVGLAGQIGAGKRDLAEAPQRFFHQEDRQGAHQRGVLGRGPGRPDGEQRHGRRQPHRDRRHRI